jgi:hypothetical protein
MKQNALSAAPAAQTLHILGPGSLMPALHKAWTGSAWEPAGSDWDNLGGPFGSRPVVCSWGPARLDVFVTGFDATMFHKYWADGRWLPDGQENWEPLGLGQKFASEPAVVSWAANRLDVVALGLDGQLYHKAWDGSAWLPSPTQWEPRPPPVNWPAPKSGARFGRAPQRSQPRDWRHRDMGKGLVSEMDLNPHVCDLRRCLPGPC